MPAALGLRAFETPDASLDATLRASLLYPTTGQEAPYQHGPYALNACVNGPLDGPPRPLVIISHGNGGSSFTHRDTARALAQAGFVVALLEHHGNCRTDNSLAGTRAMLHHRPRQVTLLLDALAADATLAAQLRLSQVGLIGHSIGGYTGLALAGGQPVTTPFDTPVGPIEPVTVMPDPRLGALVLLAPATPWFAMPEALARVRIPVLMYTGEADALAPLAFAQIVERGLTAAPLEHHRIANAGHFSFQTPFPPAMCTPGFPPAHDPPGFDRAAFHVTLNTEIVRFMAAQPWAQAA